MKKLFSILLLSMVVFAASAQYTTPRTGTGANNDNTFRALTFKYLSVTDNAGADTVKLALNAYQTQISIPTLTDSVTFSFSSVAKCYLGDVVRISFIGTSGSKVKFLSTNCTSSGTATLSTGLTGTVSFAFNGVKWVEVGRLIF